jgi:hypothetical protein
MWDPVKTETSTRCSANTHRRYLSRDRKPQRTQTRLTVTVMKLVLFVITCSLFWKLRAVSVLGSMDGKATPGYDQQEINASILRWDPDVPWTAFEATPISGNTNKHGHFRLQGGYCGSVYCDTQSCCSQSRLPCCYAAAGEATCCPDGCYYGLGVSCCGDFACNPGYRCCGSSCCADEANDDDSSSSGSVGVIVGLSVGVPVAIGLGIFAIKACVTGESKVTVAAAG